MKKIFLFLIMFMSCSFFSCISFADTTNSGTFFSGENNATINLSNHESSKIDKSSDELGRKLPLWSTLPFVGILLSIAIFPLVAPHFWHRHYPKVAAFWALIFAIPFIYFYHHDATHKILHIYLVDYIPFMVMLWSLFTIAGGIVLKGTLVGTPLTNTVLLTVGTLLASWVGTTGASMIMIRPVLRANTNRRNKAHIVCFFIFLVANIGGSLTPLGDPPLFLGFLHGVPFFWTLKLFPEMLFASFLLLLMFFFVDRFFYRREVKEGQLVMKKKKISIRLEGWHNFFFLAGVVGAILISGIIKWNEVNMLGIPIPKQNLFRDILMIVMGLLSLVFTKKNLRKANEFTWEPIKEVAYLFAGIFMTIIPALAILKSGTDGALGFLINVVNKPYQYYWVTGGLSSFLDNAPTYLTFFNTILGKLHISENLVHQILLGNGNGNFINQEFILLLQAISVGSVFMGANTYIGNAPNFMVKSIAEESGVGMPSFFGYMFKYSIPILIPLFLLITFVFF